MHRGYIKIWRKTLDSGLLQMPETFTTFMFILMKATHKPIKIGSSNGIIELERGQYISGRKELAKQLGLTERKIRTSLERLEEYEILTIKTTNKYSIYTIVNYNNYQDLEDETTSTSTNKRPTNDQQTTTKQEHKHINTNTTTLSEYSDEFELFWKAYPKKVGKGGAYQSWKKQKPSVDNVLNALRWQTRTPSWTKENGQFVPNPATYINQRRWEDGNNDAGNGFTENLK